MPNLRICQSLSLGLRCHHATASAMSSSTGNDSAMPRTSRRELCLSGFKTPAFFALSKAYCFIYSSAAGKLIQSLNSFWELNGAEVKHCSFPTKNITKVRGRKKTCTKGTCKNHCQCSTRQIISKTIQVHAYIGFKNDRYLLDSFASPWLSLLSVGTRNNATTFTSPRCIWIHSDDVHILWCILRTHVQSVRKASNANLQDLHKNDMRILGPFPPAASLNP